MNTKQNVNKRKTETQVTELGTATELTLGVYGSDAEGKRNWQPRRRTSQIETSKQITELGAATKLTLGVSGKISEGRHRYVQSISC